MPGFVIIGVALLLLILFKISKMLFKIGVIAVFLLAAMYFASQFVM